MILTFHSGFMACQMLDFFYSYETRIAREKSELDLSYKNSALLFRTVINIVVRLVGFAHWTTYFQLPVFSKISLILRDGIY